MNGYPLDSAGKTNGRAADDGARREAEAVDGAAASRLTGGS